MKDILIKSQTEAFMVKPNIWRQMSCLQVPNHLNELEFI